MPRCNGWTAALCVGPTRLDEYHDSGQDLTEISNGEWCTSTFVQGDPGQAFSLKYQLSTSSVVNCEAFGLLVLIDGIPVGFTYQEVSHLRRIKGFQALRTVDSDYRLSRKITDKLLKFVDTEGMYSLTPRSAI